MHHDQVPDANFDEATGQWISKAQVAEVPFTAFTSKKQADQVPGRLVVRRIPDLNVKAKDGQATLFDTWRFHAFFTTTDAAELDTPSTKDRQWKDRADRRLSLARAPRPSPHPNTAPFPVRRWIQAKGVARALVDEKRQQTARRSTAASIGQRARPPRALKAR